MNKTNKSEPLFLSTATAQRWSWSSSDRLKHFPTNASINDKFIALMLFSSSFQLCSSSFFLKEYCFFFFLFTELENVSDRFNNRFHLHSYRTNVVFHDKTRTWTIRFILEAFVNRVYRYYTESWPVAAENQPSSLPCSSCHLPFSPIFLLSTLCAWLCDVPDATTLVFSNCIDLVIQLTFSIVIFHFRLCMLCSGFKKRKPRSYSVTYEQLNLRSVIRFY